MLTIDDILRNSKSFIKADLEFYEGKPQLAVKLSLYLDA